jgi:hypothetical protein
MVQAGFLGKLKLLEWEWEIVNGHVFWGVRDLVIVLEFQCFFIGVWLLI